MNTTLKETLKTLVTNMKAFLSENYPTTNSLTGSATIATKNSNTVVIKAGISESDGVISNSAGADITLADVASTGSYADLSNKPAIKVGQGENSIIEGDIDNNVAGNFSRAEGYHTQASGLCSHAEGERTTASGHYSHAEGYDTTASGHYSHTEGSDTTASGPYSHTEGGTTTASGYFSHAEGSGTTASGDTSHAEGYQTTAKNRSQHAFGEFNEKDPSTASSDARGTYIEIVGNGADESARSNARTLDWDGNETLAGNLTIGGAITANGQQILPQKQADWNQTTSTGSDYIKNKPTKLSDFINDGEGGSPSDPFTTTGEVYATFKKLYPQISTSTELSATTFNSIGVLTESITFTLPTIAAGTAPEFNGQFTADSSATYSVTFPAGIVMQGDTTIEANGTYQFSICNGYGVIIKVA